MDIVKDARKSLAVVAAFAVSALFWGLVDFDSVEFIGTGQAGFQDTEPASFNKPIRMAPFDVYKVVVADIYNHAIRIVSLNGEVVTLAGGPDRKGHRDGPVDKAEFSSPHGVAVSAGRIVVAEAGNHTIRAIDKKSSGYVVSTIAGQAGVPGYLDGPLDDARFNSPHGLLKVKDGYWVADIGNGCIRHVTDTSVRTVPGTKDYFQYPMDLAFDQNGDVLVVDAGKNELVRINRDKQIAPVVLQEPLYTPHGITVDENGRIFVADMEAHRVVEIHRDGRVEQIYGTGVPGDDEASLNKPAAVLAMSHRLWIADLENHRLIVHKL